jgi:hypothetical protein
MLVAQKGGAGAVDQHPSSELDLGRLVASDGGLFLASLY